MLHTCLWSKRLQFEMLLFQEIPILLTSSKIKQKNLNFKLFLYVFIQTNKRIFTFSYAHWQVLEWNIAGETVALCSPTTCIYTLDNGIVCLRSSKWSFLPDPHHFGECFCHHREPGHRRMCLKGHFIIGHFTRQTFTGKANLYLR